MKYTKLVIIYGKILGAACRHIAGKAIRPFIYAKRFYGAKIYPSAVVDQKSSLGKNTVLLQRSFFLNSSLGDFSYLGRDCFIQDASIGKYCSIGNGVCIGLGRHPLDLLGSSPVFYKRNNVLGFSIASDESFAERERISIGNDVWIGTRSIVLDGVSIGSGAVIAAGAVVTKDVAPYTIVAGVPARRVGQRFDDEVVAELLQTEWWDLDTEELKNLANASRFKK